MKSKNFMTEDTLSWLLDNDSPGVRYLALRDLVELSSDDPDLKEAQADAHKNGPIATVLDNMNT